METETVDEPGTPLNRDELGARMYHTLKHEGVTTLEQAAQYTASELGRVPNLGRASIRRLSAVLAAHNMQLKRPMTYFVPCHCCGGTGRLTRETTTEPAA